MKAAVPRAPRDVAVAEPLVTPDIGGFGRRLCDLGVRGRAHSSWIHPEQDD